MLSEQSNILQNRNLLCAGLLSSESLKRNSDFVNRNDSTLRTISSYADGIPQQIKKHTIRSLYSGHPLQYQTVTSETSKIAAISDAAATNVWCTSELEDVEMNFVHIPVSAQCIAKVKGLISG